jgi:hypothetical protein
LSLHTAYSLAQLAPLVGRVAEGLLDGLVQRVPSIGEAATGVPLVPLLEVVEDDCGDVSGTVFVVKAAEEDDADGLEPAPACIGCDNAARLALRAPADRLRPVPDIPTVISRVNPECWYAVCAAENGCKAAVMEDHGVKIERIPPVTPQAGRCKDPGGTARRVERGLDPAPWQHDASADLKKT